MARLQGSISTHDNNEVQQFLKTFTNVYDLETFNSEVPNWIQDCLRGSTGQITGNTRVSTYKIFSILSSLSVISTATVGEKMNKKRIAVDGKPYSRSMIEYYTRALRCASQAIAHHKARYHVDKETGEVETAVPSVIYTDEQKAKMRELAIAGKLEELSAYVKEINEPQPTNEDMPFEEWLMGDEVENESPSFSVNSSVEDEVFTSFFENIFKKDEKI